MALSSRWAGAGVRCGLRHRSRAAERCGYPRLTADRTLPTVLVNILHRIGDGADILGILVLDLEIELLLHRHDDFDQIERIGVEIADELGVHRYFIFVDAEPIGDDSANALKRRSHPRSSPPYAARCGRVGSTETLPQGPACGKLRRTDAISENHDRARLLPSGPDRRDDTPSPATRPWNDHP